jgi:YDG domain/Kelch motif/Galactose oxidase, central domain
MKRPAAALLGCIAVLLLIAVAGVATIPTVPTGTWQPMGSMTAARSGAAAVLLQDHRVLITGGNNGTDAVNSVEVFNTDGSFANASAMGTPRSGHIAVLLRDERVLVAGGVTSGGGTTNSAEIYDPWWDTWTAIAGGMTEGRSKATAVLLQDGRVLIAGGQNGSAPSSTLEIFDPNTEQFSYAGSLSSPRMGLASASLADGRVLITGGSNGNVPVASIDVFNPTTNTVSAGPAMTSPRVGHSATSLLDGRVLVAGGNNGSADLASAEVFDPAVGGFAVVASNLAAPRRDHAAILLPNNNAVLIVGGTSVGNEVGTAETFAPWTGRFSATGSPAILRQQAAVSGLKQDGLLLMAGGSSGGTPVSSAELFGFATVKTDKADYAPGEVVTITGSGWQPGETVTLTLVESPLEDTHPVITTVADGQGHITNADFAPDEHDFNIRFYLTAVGGQSGYQALNTFTDNGNKSIFSDTNTTAQTTAFGTISANQCGNSWLVAMQGSNLATAPVGGTPPGIAAMSSTPAGATFFAGSGCSGSPVTSLSLGTTNVSAQFSFRIATVGNYTIRGAGSWDNGGAGNDASATVTVGQATSTVTASPATGTYGGTVTLSAVLSANGVGVSGKTITFQLNGDNAGTATTDSTGTAIRSNVSLISPSKINAGTFASGVSASFAGDSSFTAGSGTNTLTVNQKAITVTAATNSKTYDATTSATTTPTITTGGPLVTGDTANFTESYDNKNVGTNKTLTPSGTVSDGNGGNNYSYTFAPNTTGVITTRNLTVTAATNTKTYDATTSAAATPTITTGTLQGTDTANFTEAYANKNAGSNLALIPSGTVNDGNSGNNYAVTFANNTTGVINKASLTLTAVTNTKTYDATTSAAAIPTSSGLQGSDTVTGLTESYDNKNAGNGKILSVNAGYTVNDGNSGGNYTVTTQTNATGVINEASVTPSLTADDKDYDTTNTATIHCTLAGVLAADTGNVTCSGTGTFADPSAGTKAVTSNDLVLSGAASGNYMLSTTTASTTATIRKVNATITVTPYTVTYDGDPHTATGTAKGIGGADLSAYLNLTGTTHTIAGTYTDTWTFTGSPNYNDATNTVSDVINKADPVIVASGITVTYDGQPHAGTATATGVKGEALTPVNVAYTVVLAPPRNPGDLLTSAPVIAGNYLVAARFAGETNYNQKQSAAVPLIINKADAHISVTGYNVTYDANAHTATGTAAGVESPTPADLSSLLHLNGTTHTDAGDFTDNWTFDGNENYNATSGTVHDHIEKANATVSVSPYSVTYNAVAHMATGTATGVGGVDLSAGLNLTLTTHTDAGDYPNDPWSFSGGVNYKDQSGTVHDHIDKADATVSVTGYTVFYNGAPHTATGTATGVGGVDLSAGFNFSGTSHTDAGDYPNDPWSFSGAPNYNDKNGTVHDHIDKAPVTATAGSGTATYDGTTKTPSACAVTGAYTGDLTCTNNPASVGPNAGTTAIAAVVSGTGLTNFQISYVPGSFTIDKATSTTTVTFEPGPYVYRATAFTAAAAVTGAGGLNAVVTPVTYSGDCVNVTAGGCTGNATYGGDQNHYGSSGSANIMITPATPTIIVTGVTTAYDGDPHPANGTAKGIGGVTVPGSFSFVYTPGGNAVPTLPGLYSALGTFTSASPNYVSGGTGTGTVNIGYGVCSAGPGGVILPPINSDGSSVYQRKGGSTIPVKFRVCAANGSAISNPAAVFAGTIGPMTMLSAVRGTIDNINEAAGTDIPDAAFRFDGSQWIFNMATNNLQSGNTYLFRINLANGSIQFVVGVK